MIEVSVPGEERLRAVMVKAGDDICVTVTGGQAHIGSVSIGIPRPSLTGSGASATVSTFNLTGHKDNAVGDRIAHDLAAATGKTVVVTCGIHIDSASAQDIARLLTMADELLDKLLRSLEKEGA